jgi:hypothetical protein
MVVSSAIQGLQSPSTSRHLISSPYFFTFTDAVTVPAGQKVTR